jgi:hypothetical protein
MCGGQMTEKTTATTATAATAATSPPGAVSVEIDTLTTFRDRVNTLLTSLSTGAAAPGKIAEQGLTGPQLGSRFEEVSLLMTRYGLVHDQLKALSQALTDQINAMEITLQVSQVGYHNVEAEQISRLWSIQNQTTASQPPPAQANWTVDQQIAAGGSTPPTKPTTAATPTSASTPGTSPTTPAPSGNRQS